jgi:hypothetical protein
VFLAFGWRAVGALESIRVRAARACLHREAIVFICVVGADSTSRFDRKNASGDGKPWSAGLGADTGTKWNHRKNVL